MVSDGKIYRVITLQVICLAHYVAHIKLIKYCMSIIIVYLKKWKKKSTIHASLFLGSVLYFIGFMTVFMPVPHWCDYCSFEVHFEICKFVLVFKFCSFRRSVLLSGVPCVHINFRIGFSISIKYTVGLHSICRLL